MGGPRRRGWVFVGLPSCFLSGLLGRLGGPRRLVWVFVGLPSCLLSGLLGRMQEAGLPLGSFIFPFWAAGSMGSLHISFLGSWVGWVSRGVGLPSCFLFTGLLGRMGGPRPRSGLLGRMGGPRRRVGVFVGLPSCFLCCGSWVGWVGRGKEAGLPLAPFIFPFWAPGSDGLPLGSLHVSFFLGSWVGWVGRGDGVGLALGSLISFLGSWVGWVSRGQEAGLLLGSLHVSFFLGSWVGGWAAAKKLGSHCAPFILLFCGSDRWAAAKKLGSRCAPFMFPSFWVLGRMGGPRQKSWAPIGLLSYFPNCTVWGSLFRKKVCGGGWMGGPRRRGWARIGHPSCSWAPGMFPFLGRMGGRRRRSGLPLRSLHQWAPFMFPFWAPFLFPLGSLHVSFLGSAAAPFINGLPSCFLFGLLSCLGMGGPRRFPSCFLSGVLGRSGSLHVSFLGSLHVPFLGRMGGPRRRGWAYIGLPSLQVPCLGSKIGWVVLGRMGGPRRRGGLPSCFPYCLNIHFAASAGEARFDSNTFQLAPA